MSNVKTGSGSTAPHIENMAQLERLLPAYFYGLGPNSYAEGRGRQRGIPLVLMGPPGAAKTAGLMQFTRRQHFKGKPISSYLFDPGSMGEASLGVTPVPTYIKFKNPKGVEEDRMVLSFPPGQPFLQKFPHGVPGVLILDDFTNARGAVQDAYYGLTTRKVAGDHQLDVGIRVFGAANPTEMTPGGELIAMPAWNRFCTINVRDPSVQEFITFMANGGSGDFASEENIVDVEAEEKRIDKIFDEEAYPRAVGLVAGWLERRPTFMRHQPEVGTDAAQGPWASPRSHELGIRALASALAYKLDEHEQMIMFQSAVGREAANDFHSWKVNQDLPSPALFLDGVESFTHNPDRLDRTVAVVQGCIALLSSKSIPKRAARANAYAKFLLSIAETNEDVVVPSLLFVYKNFRDLTTKNKDLQDTFRELLKVTSGHINMVY